MSTRVVVFPFDLFGGSAAGEGARLLADEIREMIRDAKSETVATRARAWAGQIRLRELPFDNLAAVAGWRSQGEKQASSLLLTQDKILWLGGNHLACLPIYDCLSGTGVQVLQFDAHLDIHDFQDSIDTPSHGNFLLHAKQPLVEIVNVGHRDLLIEQDRINRYYQGTVSALEIARDSRQAADRVFALTKARDIWIDIDCDVFDPVDFPATGRPVPMGISPQFLFSLLEAIPAQRIKGVSLSEFDPARDNRDQCLALLTWLAEYLFLRWYEQPDRVV
ncbi:MAG: hypothetical protein EXR99_05510 [Gemmataceae bacterium]|nr:hypothetical protein [Gemmataceae bacterium]